MKRTILGFATLIFVSMSVFAQSEQEEIELYQTIFGMGKKAVVAELIGLENPSADAFWGLYDQYESERKLHGQKRLELIDQYAKNYETMDEVKADALVKEMISLSDEYDKLIRKYYGSIKKSSGTKAAAQFFQLEVYFQSAIRVAIMEQIPFIGEFDH